MIEVKAFKMEHLDTFEPKEDFDDLEKDMTRNLLNSNIVILTLIWEEKTLAIVGVNQHRIGSGELWLLPSIHVDSCPFEFFKSVKNLIYKFVFPALGYHRLEIAILANWKKGMRWAKALGFKISHLCKAYDIHRRDHIIYYKVV